MNNNYSKYIVKSVDYIFKNFLHDTTIEEVFENQATENDPVVTVEINGTLSGEIMINFPEKTLNHITKRIVSSPGRGAMKKHYKDVAGELANLITGAFANQMQFLNHNICLSAPEYNNDMIQMKALYENINLSFSSSFGGFDIDLYYKED